MIARWSWIVVLTLIAGCARGNGKTPLAPPGAPPASENVVLLDALPIDVNDKSTPEVVVQIPHHMVPLSFAWTGDGRTLLSHAGDSEKIWDLRSDLLVRTTPVAYADPAFRPDGAIVAGISDAGKKLTFVDARTMTPKYTRQGDFASVAFDPDGSSAAIGMMDGRVILVSPDGEKDLAVLHPTDSQRKAVTGGVLSITYDRSGKRFAMTSGRSAFVFEVSSRKMICEVNPRREATSVSGLPLEPMTLGLAAKAIAMDGKGEQLAMTRNDGFNAIWDIATCTQKHAYLAPERKLPSQVPGQELSTPIYTFEIVGALAEGRGFLLLADEETTKTTYRWQPLENAKEPVRFLPNVPSVDTMRVTLSPDGTLFVASPVGGGMTLYDAVKEVPIRSFGNKTIESVPLAVNEQASELVLGRSHPKAVDILDLRSLSKLRSISLPEKTLPYTVTADGSGRVLAYGVESDKRTTIQIIDLASSPSRTLTTLPEGEFLGSISLNEDGSMAYLAVGTPGRRPKTGTKQTREIHLRAHDVRTGRRLWDVEVKTRNRELDDVTTSRAGNVLLDVEDNRRVMVRDLRTGAEKGSLLPPNEKDTHRGEILSVTISADGRRAVTTSDWGEVYAWDLSRRALIERLADVPKDAPRTGGPFAVFTRGKGDQLTIINKEGRADAYDGKTFAPTGEPPTKQHEGRALVALPSSTGRYLVSYGADTTIRIKRHEATAGNVMLVSAEHGEYVAIAPGNQYLAPKSALDAVGFRVGLRAYPFDSFDAKLNRPEAVLTELGAAPSVIARARDLTARRLKRLGLTDKSSSLSLAGTIPVVEIISPPPPPTTTARVLPLKVRARAALADLDRVAVFVNEVPVQTLPLRDRHARAVEITSNITLGIGANRVQVSGFTVDGVESLRETVSVTLANAPNAEKPDLHVIVVGVSHYRNSRLDLDYAAKDARDIAAFFRRTGTARFRAVKVTEVTDQEATREHVLGLDKVLKATAIDDQVVFFVAGHGFLGPESEYFFAPHDVDTSSKAKAAASAVSFGDIERLLTLTPSRKKVMLMDTCHSGEVDDLPAGAALAPNVRAKPRSLDLIDDAAPQAAGALLSDNVVQLSEEFADVRRGSGAVVLASASGRELAFEGTQKNGLFTFSVLDGLTSNHADRDADGIVRVSELRDFVSNRVVTLSGGLQHPTARRENVVLDFPMF